MTATPYDVSPGTPDPSCYACLGKGTIQWGFIPAGQRCSCVEHAAGCEPGMCEPNCPSKGEDEFGFPQRCVCCDGASDGFGVFHFADLGRSVRAVDLLRDWLASPFRVEGIPIDLHDGPEFATARDADEWLDQHDRVATVERAIDAHMEFVSGRSL